MGGGGQAFGMVGRGLEAVSTFGLSEAARAANIPGANQALNLGAAVFQTPTYLASAAARTGAGVSTVMNAPNDAKIDADRQAKQQDQQAQAQLDALKLSPQVVRSDDFLARKQKQLSDLRMGIAATMGAGGSAAAPNVLTPTLKTKLGQ